MRVFARDLENVDREREVRCEVTLGESGNYFSIRDIFTCGGSFFSDWFIIKSF